MRGRWRGKVVFLVKRTAAVDRRNFRTAVGEILRPRLSRGQFALNFRPRGRSEIRTGNRKLSRAFGGLCVVDAWVKIRVGHARASIALEKSTVLATWVNAF